MIYNIVVFFSSSLFLWVLFFYHMYSVFCILTPGPPHLFTTAIMFRDKESKFSLNHFSARLIFFNKQCRAYFFRSRLIFPRINLQLLVLFLLLRYMLTLELVFSIFYSFLLIFFVPLLAPIYMQICHLGLLQYNIVFYSLRLLSLSNYPSRSFYKYDFRRFSLSLAAAVLHNFMYSYSLSILSDVLGNLVFSLDLYASLAISCSKLLTNFTLLIFNSLFCIVIIQLITVFRFSVSMYIYGYLSAVELLSDFVPMFLLIVCHYHSSRPPHYLYNFSYSTVVFFLCLVCLSGILFRGSCVGFASTFSHDI